MLDIWSHGFSIFGVGFDQSHENDSLTPYEIRKGIEESNLSRVDVLIFSACLMMDLGVLGELKDYVEAVTGSADSVPGDGSFYGNSGNRGIVGVIEDYSSSTSVDMAKAICVANYESYFNKNQQNAYGDIYQFLTYSAVDQSKADKVMSSLKELILDNSGELRSSFFQLFSEFILNESVFYSCYDYSGTSNVGDVLDLGSFAYALSKSGNAKADALLQSIKEYIVEAKHIRAEPEFNEEHIGLGILFKYPESNFGSYYINTNETYRNTGWNLLINPDN
ncbi:MAG TPA: hypothetical protein DEP20_02975 [Fusobacteria bacterium]|nr:hypothetical protein [Fusobacteriota bacterium]